MKEQFNWQVRPASGDADCHHGWRRNALLFRYPDREIRCSNSKIAPGIDIKGDGGYVILPPSGRASGRSYFWDGDFDLDAVAEMPQWLLQLIDASEADTTSASSDGNSIPEGQ
jgi:hypothetical protein